MGQQELIKLAEELETLAVTPDEVDPHAPVQILSGLFKEANNNVDNEYAASVVHGILDAIERM